MKKQVKPIVFLICIVVMILSGCQNPNVLTEQYEEHRVIRLITDFQVGEEGYQQLDRFAQLVDEQSQGDIEIVLYTQQQWGMPKHFLEYVQLNNVEMVCLSTAALSDTVAGYQSYDLPYLFPTIASVQQYVMGKKGTESLDFLQQHQLYGLGFVCQGYDYFLHQRGMIVTGNELYGMKMNIADWRQLTINSLAAIGIQGVKNEINNNADRGALVSAAQIGHLGEIKGVDESIFVSDPQMFYRFSMVVTNLTWWNQMDDQLQQLLTQCFQQAQKEQLDKQERTTLSVEVEQVPISVAPISEQMKATYYNNTRAVVDQFFQQLDHPLKYHWISQPAVIDLVENEISVE